MLKKASIIASDASNDDKPPVLSFKNVSQKVVFLRWNINQWFENFIYLLILVSMILLILDNPMNDPDSKIS